jgi:hypothetical protein
MRLKKLGGRSPHLAKATLANKRTKGDLLGIDEMHPCRRSAGHSPQVR